MARRSAATWPTYFAVLLLGMAGLNTRAAEDASTLAATRATSTAADGGTSGQPSFLPNRDSTHALRGIAADATPSPPTGSIDRPVTLIELPREVRLGSVPPRPHHALGFRSHAAENWLRDHGFDAKTCYLPMLRVPARITPSGDASVAFWIYARCSFQ